MTTETFTCAYCGESNKDLWNGEIVFPYGDTCEECAKELKVLNRKYLAINAIKVSIDATNPEETELIADLYKAIELLEGMN